DIFAFLCLVTLHDFGPVDRLVLLGAVPDLLDARMILFMKHVEMDRFGACCGIKPHRKRHQAETHVTSPNDCRHLNALLWLRAPDRSWPPSPHCRRTPMQCPSSIVASRRTAVSP